MSTETLNSMDDLRNKIAEKLGGPEPDGEIRPENTHNNETVTPEAAPAEVVPAPAEVVPAEVVPESTIPKSPEELAALAPETPAVETPAEVVPPTDADPNANPAGDYVPDVTYKAMGQEHKFDDFLAGSIKTKEQEEAVRKIYEKAKGLDHFTEKNNQLKTQLDNLQPELQVGKNLQTEINYYNQLIKDGKLHDFTRAAKIPDDDILKLAHEILSVKDLTPVQQQQYNQNIESNSRLYQVELENQRLQGELQNTGANQIQNDLGLVLQRPDYVNTIQSFDERVGQGSFNREVITRAANHEKLTGNSLTPQEAVEQVLNLIGHSAQETPAPVQQTPAPAATIPQTVPPVGTQVQDPSNQVVVKQNPTIPNVAGANITPVKKVYKSIDDLKNAYKEKYDGP